MSSTEHQDTSSGLFTLLQVRMNTLDPNTSRQEVIARVTGLVDSLASRSPGDLSGVSQFLIGVSADLRQGTSRVS